MLCEAYYGGHQGQGYLEEELTKSHNVSRHQSLGCEGFSKVLRGYSKGIRGIEGLGGENTQEYARLCRTSVKIQSTDESLYN